MSTAGFDTDLVNSVDHLFAAAVGPDVLAACDTSGLSPALWSRVADLGFHLVGIDDERGGSGGSLLDALAVAFVAGRHAVPLPVVETHLAAWALTGSDVVVGPGPMTVAPGTSRDDVLIEGTRAEGVLQDVAWVPGVERVVALAGADAVLSIDPAACDITAGQDLAGQPRSTVRFHHADVLPAGDGVTPRTLALRGALLRAGQLAGAMETVAQLTIEHCDQRQQFGRPLSAFQAVQQHLVTLAQSAELSALSVVRAGITAATRDASFEISCAKLIANQCAAESVRATHQAHGAISMTMEYRVQFFTRRLNAWRWEFGTEPDLATELGTVVAGADSFFATIASERTSPEVAACRAR